MSHYQPLLYLASASPRRHEILEQMGVAHEVLDVPAPPGEDEPRHPGEPPERYVRRTAHEKAVRAVEWLQEPGCPILTADTTVVLGDHILGKPQDAEDAHRMLRQLSGTTHHVHTAIIVAHEGSYHEDVSITAVTMRGMTDAEIEAYCATGEPFGKAGAYGIQGKASFFIESISGSFSGVMGLPIFETYRLLSSLGIFAIGASAYPH